MSLGVLNNLNAINAEANLNNTSASLSKTLQQLSSGSKINSGADDAAGLSLVNGLQANSMALTQSQTNSTEGVGLLTVADGALSQVTNLLNRAVTLATEASNGTLNTSQDTAANQEYQSILSEISNIGTTTTYNDRSVFGTNTNIYTGDSTTTGASVDSLNIRSLSSSNVGDTGGAIAYGTGSSGNNVFIDLAGGTTSGAIGDTLNTTGTTGTTLTINTLSSTGTVVANNITVGGSSGFDNTAQGMINAINSSGLGVTASFTSAAVAGDSTATATDMGIMISGSVGAGAQPSASSFSGVVAAAGDTSQNANKDDIVSGSITLQVGNGAATTVTASQVATANSEANGAVTMTQMAAYITANASLGVTAGIGSNGALDLADTNGSAALKVTTNLVDNSLTTTSANSQTTSYTATAAYSAGLSSAAFGANSVTDTTSGQFGASANAVIANGSVNTTGGTATISYTDNAGTSLSGTDLTTQADSENTLNALNTAISAVSAQDGYIGAQINTLNSVSSVLSTQSENVTAAQNAVQATDYASAASNMSKYQILSQTGISALAQANSVQQEVTKLLQ
jgi:flagellin